MANNKFTPEQREALEAAKKAKSPEELIAMAKEHGVEITEEQAKAFLGGELSDEEMENVAGGAFWDFCFKGKHYHEIPKPETPTHNAFMSGGGEDW